MEKTDKVLIYETKSRCSVAYIRTWGLRLLLYGIKPDVFYKHKTRDH